MNIIDMANNIEDPILTTIAPFFPIKNPTLKVLNAENNDNIIILIYIFN